MPSTLPPIPGTTPFDGDQARAERIDPASGQALGAYQPNAVLRWFREAGAAADLAPRFMKLHEELRRDASSQAAAAIAQVVSSRHG